jgi:hypothetical protein
MKKTHLIEGYMMFNEDIRSKKSFQHKKYTNINTQVSHSSNTIGHLVA